MKYDCALMQDIVSLYKDNALSEKSKQIVEEHLAECGACRALYNGYSEEKELPESTEEISTAAVITYSKKIKRRRTAIVCCVLAVVLYLAAAFCSYVYLDTADPIAAGVGLLRVMVFDSEPIEIQKNPRVVIARPERFQAAFEAYVAAEGYTYLAEERLGKLHYIEKDGEKELVWLHGNRFYALWSWD